MKTVMKKKWVAVVLAVLLLFGIAVAVFTYGSASEIATDVRYTQDIVVEKGVAKETSHTIPFTLKDDGTYQFTVDWNAVKEGVITGFAVRNQTDEIVFCVTGESVEAESTELELTAGEYRAEYQFITDEQQFAKLQEEANLINYSNDSEEYVYATDTSYETEYHFVAERLRSESYKLGMLVGMLVGAAVGIILIAFILKYVKTDKRDEAKYDERQLKVRGDGFKYGFFTGLFYNMILCLIHIAEIKIPIAEEVLLFLCIIISVSVYAIYCIRKEAYISLNESASRFKIMFSALGVMNIGIGLMAYFHGGMIVDGVLTFRCLNLLCGIFLLVIAIVLHIHMKLIEKEEEE